MPTESTFLLVGLFFLAAALGYFFARFGDDSDEASTPAGRLNADYIKGLNYLLNEQPDRALEVFMRMVAVDDETLETHFALGSLFRRRGEVDRAIRVHQNIIARPNLSDMHREQAVISLAEDYLSAGLFDRAEKLFHDLSASPGHRVFALRKLIRIFEVTRDWQQAIDAWRELEKVDEDAVTQSRAAHYLCEMAEQAVVQRDYDRARELLNKALRREAATVRVRLSIADLDREVGDHKAAIKNYLNVMDQHPHLIGEVVPRLAASCRDLGDQVLLTRCLGDICRKTPSASKAIALATVYDARIVNTTALECLRDYVLQDKVLGKLVDGDRLRQGDDHDQLSALSGIREGLVSLISQAHRYRCSECGYVSSQLLWQCPGCRTWETVVPSVQLSFSSFVN